MADTQDLNVQAEKIATLRAEEAQAAFVKKRITEQLEQAEAKMLSMLEDSGLKSYRAPAGNCVITHRTSVRTPKTPEDRKAFFDYLKSKGIFDAMIGVNSATLNSYYKEEFEVASREGRVLEIPGLTEITVDAILSFRK